MGKHEVTFEEYDRFAIDTDRKLPEDQGWGRGQRPVINVSWEDAKAYAANGCQTRLATATGLPTESEWEYAARSGDKQEPWAGTSDEGQLDQYAVYISNSENRTTVVGSKQANSFGVKDLSGNVWEWVEDCAHGSYHNAPTDGSAWLEANRGDCSKRIIRGGAWGLNADFLRSSRRNKVALGDRGTNVGFRLVQTGSP